MKSIATLNQNLADAASVSTSWGVTGQVDNSFPYLVGTISSDKIVTVTLEQSHDGSAVAFTEVISNVPGNTTMAANTKAGFRFARVAPYFRITIANASGAVAAIKANLYGSE